MPRKGGNPPQRKRGRLTRREKVERAPRVAVVRDGEGVRHVDQPRCPATNLLIFATEQEIQHELVKIAADVALGRRLNMRSVTGYFKCNRCQQFHLRREVGT